MIDLGQYDAIKAEPLWDSITFIYQVYAEPDRLIAEFSNRREAHRVLEADFDNRYIRKLTPKEWCNRYGYERVLTHKDKKTVGGQCQHLVQGQWLYIPMNDQWEILGEAK